MATHELEAHLIALEMAAKAGQLPETILRRIEALVTGSRPEIKSALFTSAPALSPEIQAQLEAAEKLFGKDFMGPQQFEKAWGFIPSNIPPIPFSDERLASAQKMGMMLRLAVDKTPDGSLMTMKAMNTMQAKIGRKPKGLYYNTDRYNDEAFFNEAPRNGWRLESKVLLEGSTGKNEVEQLEVIVCHLKDTIFAEEEMPVHYSQAIAQFEARKEQITQLMKSENDWPKASIMIKALNLGELTRATPAEMIQAIETQHQNDEDGAFLYPNTYVRTPRLYADGHLVFVGFVSANGAGVGGYGPERRFSQVGVALSLQP